MADLKTLGTFAIIIGCFAVIYPRFMHPMVLRVLGMEADETKEEEQAFPPHMRNNPQIMRERKPPPMPSDPKDVRQHMRPGPHPGLRAAAEMQKQQSQGSGRGMMGIVLPMYAIGICVYLAYTLFKVFNKRGKYPDPYSRTPTQTQSPSQSQYDQYGSARYAPEQQQETVDSLGFPREMRGAGEEVQQYLKDKKQQKEFEDLLCKMDDTKNVSEEEMRALQKRLEETEAQMTRILQAMQTMQSKMTTATTDVLDTVETVKAAAAADESKGEPSEDSNPSSESYEMVKNAASSADTDVSPTNEDSSPSFEQVPDEAVEEEGEDIVMEKKKEEEEGVRQRKSAHGGED